MLADDWEALVDHAVMKARHELLSSAFDQPVSVDALDGLTARSPNSLLSEAEAEMLLQRLNCEMVRVVDLPLLGRLVARRLLATTDGGGFIFTDRGIAALVAYLEAFGGAGFEAEIVRLRGAQARSC